MKKIYSQVRLSLFLVLLSCTGILAQGPNVTATSTNCTCPAACNGTASATVSGGSTPYTYSWTPSGGTAANAISLCPGTYTITVTDHTGLSQSKTVTITQPAPLNAGFSPSNVSCNGASDGLIYATVSGGTGPYTYSWSPIGGTTQTASSLPAGTYTLTMTDRKSVV